MDWTLAEEDYICSALGRLCFAPPEPDGHLASLGSGAKEVACSGHVRNVKEEEQQVDRRARSSLLLLYGALHL